MASTVPCEKVLEEHLQDPEFREEWERTAVARAVANQVLNIESIAGCPRPRWRVNSGFPRPSSDGWSWASTSLRSAPSAGCPRCSVCDFCWRFTRSGNQTKARLWSTVQMNA